MSGIQFNLLPDLKLQFIKTQRTKKLVTSIAILVTGISVAILLILLFTVNVVQKKQLSDADKEVKKTTSELKGITGLDNVLTIQNQLKTLSVLHNDKHITSRMFTYLRDVTPTNIKISSVTLSLENNTLTINGTTDTQLSINTFVDTLKFTTYKTSEQDSDQQAFTKVTESNFSVEDGKATYGIQMSFDPQLFSNNLKTAPTLKVPKLTTLHANVNSSTPLFNGSPESEGGQ